MSEVQSLLDRNTEIARGGTPHLSLPEALPHARAVIVGCADMRVDPALIFGLNSGEAVVLRNIGGRVTPGLLAQMGMLGRIGEVAGEVPGGGGEFNLILLQHTDCGITRLANDSAMLAGYFEVPESELPAKAVLDPRAALAVDVAALQAVPALPAEWLISGILYDVSTGIAETVVTPRRIRP